MRPDTLGQAAKLHGVISCSLITAHETIHCVKTTSPTTPSVNSTRDGMHCANTHLLSLKPTILLLMQVGPARRDNTAADGAAVNEAAEELEHDGYEELLSDWDELEQVIAIFSMCDR